MSKMNFFKENLMMPGEWVSIAQRILHQNGIVMVLGKTDSGKTSFIRLLAQYLVKRNRKVGVIDADIGQSTLGPPGTIGMYILDSKELKSGIAPVATTFFIGAISPEKCIRDFVNGVCRLSQICYKDAVDIQLIDTTGLITGSSGIQLKKRLIKKINPSFLITLQFYEELEPILREFEHQSSKHIFRLLPYQDISKKNWWERKTHRMKCYKNYFKMAELKDIDFSEIPSKGIYHGQGQWLERKKMEEINQRHLIKIISAEVVNNRMVLIFESQQNIPNQDILDKIKKEFAMKQLILLTQSWFKYLLISFNDREGLSNCLGIIKQIDFHQKHLKSYIPGDISLDHVAQIEIGQLKVKPDGTELPYEEPIIA